MTGLIVVLAIVLIMMFMVCPSSPLLRYYRIREIKKRLTQMWNAESMKELQTCISRNELIFDEKTQSGWWVFNCPTGVGISVKPLDDPAGSLKFDIPYADHTHGFEVFIDVYGVVSADSYEVKGNRGATYGLRKTKEGIITLNAYISHLSKSPYHDEHTWYTSDEKGLKTILRQLDVMRISMLEAIKTHLHDKSPCNEDS